MGSDEAPQPDHGPPTRTCPNCNTLLAAVPVVIGYHRHKTMWLCLQCSYAEPEPHWP